MLLSTLPAIKMKTTTWRLRVVIHIVDAVGYTISRRREFTRNVNSLRHRKRTRWFSTNIVVDAPYIQNENNHPAFAGGHSHC
jgi:poly-beta-hydroxyalkanoate depolymerase